MAANRHAGWCRSKNAQTFSTKGHPRMTTRLLNRRGLLASVAAGGIAGALVLRLTDIGSADEVAIDKVPEAVKKAASAVVPKVTGSGAYHDTDDGQVVEELEGEDDRERDVTAHVTAAGKVTLVE